MFSHGSETGRLFMWFEPHSPKAEEEIMKVAVEEIFKLEIFQFYSMEKGAFPPCFKKSDIPSLSQ